MMRYVICRTDSSPCQGWYWAGAGCWTNAARNAREFESMTAATLGGIVDCLFPFQEWNVVPVEQPEASDDEHRMAAALAIFPGPNQ
jgi:hypothetical protein